MERDISIGAWIGIGLLILATLIGAGFAIYSLTKNVANDGTVQMQDSLNTVNAQVFLDYDQQVITGTKVVSAIKQFEGKPIAVLVNTKAIAGGQKIAPASDRPKGAYFVRDANYAYINYNAILANSATGSTGSTVAGGTNAPTATSVSGPTIKLENGVYITDFGFALDNNGSVLYDNATGGVYKSGNAEFIPSNTKFQSNLLKDKSGAIMGIVCRQL